MKMSYLTILISIIIFQPISKAQNIDTLRSQRDSLREVRKNIQAELSRINDSLDVLKKEIEIVSGWRLDASGIVGLNLSRTNNWVGNANPNAVTSNLSIAGTFSAQRNNRRSFWRNNTSVNLAWQSQDINTNEGESSTFLENRTADIFTLSSLYGLSVSPDLALSALGDVNTALFNFLQVGSLDISSGLAYNPRRATNLVVIGHFLSYHVAYNQNAEGQLNNDSSLGAKLKISYTGNLPLNLKWTSNFNSFIPYGSPEEGNSSLFEYTWINNFAIKFWKAFGIGVNIGVRKANFETVETQWFSTVGISMSL